MKKIILLMSVILLSSCSNNIIKDAEDKFKEIMNTSNDATEVEDLSSDNLVYDNETGSYEEVELTENDISINSFKESGVDFVLYFAYDDYEIDVKTTQIIIKHANFMRNNSNISLRLEGHADARGTREYNLALGENRALSVKEIIDIYSLENEIEVISFGEEMPVANENNEQSWQKNRRVEFVYR